MSDKNNRIYTRLQQLPYSIITTLSSQAYFTLYSLFRPSYLLLKMPVGLKDRCEEGGEGYSVRLQMRVKEAIVFTQTMNSNSLSLTTTLNSQAYYTTTSLISRFS